MCTLAKAAGKVIALMDLGPGLPRRELRCEARHESGLGTARDDTCALPEASVEDGTDLSQLDSRDRSTPVAAATSSMIIWFGIAVAWSLGVLTVLPSLPGRATIFFSTGAAIGVGCWLYHLPVGVRPEELRVRDLVLSGRSRALELT